jgi:PilZ domain
MLDHPGTENALDLHLPSGIEKRRHTRHSAAWPATCFSDGGERFEAVIVNVSEGGFGLTGPVPALEVDRILFVDFDQIGTFRCRVAWTQDNRFGVEIIEDETAEEPETAFNLADVLQSLKPKAGAKS